MDSEESAIPTEAPEVVAEVVEASTDDDVELEDMEISLDDLESDEDSPASDEPEEVTTPEEVETTEESEDAQETVEEPTEVTPVAEPTKTNSDYAQERIARREAKRLADEEAQAVYLREVQGDDEETERRQKVVDDYNLAEERQTILEDRIALNEERLEVGLQKVSSIDLMKSGDPVVKEELLAELDEFEKHYVVRDERGRILEVKGDVFAHLQKKADSIRRIQGVGESKAKNDVTRQKAGTTLTPSRTPKEPSKDSDIDDFDKTYDQSS